MSIEPAADFLELDALPRPLDWVALFGVSPGEAARRRKEVEIGCGNGRYLRRAAEERPESLFLGIERSLTYARKARDRMVKYGTAPVRILKGEATRLFPDGFEAGSIDALHVYFTDPWPKKKHAKRRLFQTHFLEAAHQTLRPGAEIRVKVDLFWYFEEIFGRFENSPHFRVVESRREADAGRAPAEVTGFEQKALARKGRVFHLRMIHEPG